MGEEANERHKRATRWDFGQGTLLFSQGLKKKNHNKEQTNKKIPKERKCIGVILPTISRGSLAFSFTSSLPTISRGP